MFLCVVSFRGYLFLCWIFNGVDMNSLQESWDEAMACAQIEYDQEQYRIAQELKEKGLSAPIKTDTTIEKEENHGFYRN